MEAERNGTFGGGKINLFIIVVDDALRGAVRRLVQKSSYLTLCGESISNIDALEKIDNCLLEPKVVLVDVFAPEKDIAVIGRFKERYPWLRVLAILGFPHLEIVRRILAEGADGCLMKEELTELDRAVVRVSKGKCFISESIKELLHKSKGK